MSEASNPKVDPDLSSSSDAIEMSEAGNPESPESSSPVATYKDAVKSHQDILDEARQKHSSTKMMEGWRNTIKKTVDQCHYASLVFTTSYSTILSPKFAANKKMLGKRPYSGKGLDKEWKTPLSMMRHASHRVQVVRKAGMLGRSIMGPSEACSTMKCAFCPTLHSPGRNRLHHCPNRKCQSVGVRDECAREIAALADARVLLARDTRQQEQQQQQQQDIRKGPRTHQQPLVSGS